jgi:hypothetical protein
MPFNVWDSLNQKNYIFCLSEFQMFLKLYFPTLTPKTILTTRINLTKNQINDEKSIVQ